LGIRAGGALPAAASDTPTRAAVAVPDNGAAADGAAEVSGGLMAIATGEDTADQAQPASGVWRVYAAGADDAGGAGRAGDAGGAGRAGDAGGAAGADDAGELIGYGIRAKQGERHAA